MHLRTLIPLVNASGLITTTCAIVVGLVGHVAAQRGAPQANAADDGIRTMVGRLDLEKYKATIKGLTQFGDRRQGTDRNRAAVDWIEAQLKSYGCTKTERIKYSIRRRRRQPPQPARGARPRRHRSLAVTARRPRPAGGVRAAIATGPASTPIR